jgi:hypothetical protein
MELIGIFFVACGLLGLAGVAKTIRPDDTARAFSLLVSANSSWAPSFNSVRLTVRLGAAIEASLGACALLFPQTVTAALVAVSYALFVCIIVYARRHGGSLSTCGCFGRPDTPATALHVVLNIVLLAPALAVTLQPPHVTDLAHLLAQQPWNGVPLLLAAGVGVWLTYLALSSLSALETARRLVGRGRKALST